MEKGYRSHSAIYKCINRQAVCAMAFVKIKTSLRTLVFKLQWMNF